ncbi:phosphate ABC transporter substrate-binding protein PstS [Lacisediminihabitans sp. G11-30]|uniref:Phosphate ABC transporter substrate-binding protein PstS n=2 Tax=Lacisediminihabitans changchengi TaxID=2787634 RepID=A0A934SP44_9MICO|nr:phosphate ABC transporter substrate-binding protein PstS [Lacisediminihabitans changchengi]
MLLAVMFFAGAAAVGSSPQRAAAATYTPISGTGSTWSQNALDQWRKNVAANYGMTVNYSGTGSSAGRRDFVAGTVDFAVSEIPFQASPEDGSAAEKPPRGFAYMPIVAGGTSFMYNVKIGGKRVTNLRLGGETVTKIFTGKITNWNDPQIAADNPGLAMPNKPIVPVVRSDGSGSTAQFTLWMSKQYPALWQSFSGKAGLTSQYPVKGATKAQNGSLGVAGYVSQAYGEGAITYVEYSYALKSGFPVAKILNSSGYYVEPTAPSVAVALLKAQINTNASSAEYLTQILDGVYNNPDKRTYPLSSYSYMIVPTEVGGVFNTDKGNTLGTFASYMLCEGQQQAAALGYSPLPMNLVLAGFDQIKRVPGAGSANVDPNSCNNPTFKKGDSPSNNQLAVTAPQPAACDKQGPDQCTTGTAGAAGTATVVSGSGKGGSSSNTANAAGGAMTDGASSSAGSAADIGSADASASSGATGGAVSTPYTLASASWGTGQFVMLGAGAFLVLVIVLPALLSSRLKKLGADPKK